MVMKNNSFDFLVGEWTSRQRRLREVLSGSNEWYEFPGVHRCWRVLDGAGSFDEAVFPTQEFSGVTLRLYDRGSDEWSLYWASSRNGILAMPPQVGRFDGNGVGTFLADDVYEGRPIRVSYVWSDITDTTAHWEQAFSTDGGATWEVNWIADFQRTA